MQEPNWMSLRQAGLETYGLADYFRYGELPAKNIEDALRTGTLPVRGWQSGMVRPERIEKLLSTATAELNIYFNTVKVNRNSYERVEVDWNILSKYLLDNCNPYPSISEPCSSTSISNRHPGRPSIKEDCIIIFHKRRDRGLPLEGQQLDEARAIHGEWDRYSKKPQPEPKTISEHISGVYKTENQKR